MSCPVARERVEGLAGTTDSISRSHRGRERWVLHLEVIRDPGHDLGRFVLAELGPRIKPRDPQPEAAGAHGRAARAGLVVGERPATLPMVLEVVGEVR